MALANERPALAQGFELLKVHFGLLFQSDHCEDLNIEAHFAGRDVGMIAFDETAFFQCADPPQAGRRRNSDLLCQINVRHSAVCLQKGQNFSVNPVQFVASHHTPRFA